MAEADGAAVGDVVEEISAGVRHSEGTPSRTVAVIVHMPPDLPLRTQSRTPDGGIRRIPERDTLGLRRRGVGGEQVGIRPPAPGQHRTLLPQHLYAVWCELRITGHQGQILRQCLRDQQPVKRVVVMKWQPSVFVQVPAITLADDFDAPLEAFADYRP